ncbi:uncharacterized protein TRIADDRAFT_53885 [Trichoplax adhaerens]|uniref:G-protein coupled receptors family 1 profile domain-containing protein n=1 Tax=Trichoplax adhaerens TaxID=10228 RepID=B3RMB2_TRIAD|nr:hypothetical protein TRIADDRAFT_53885 [Trichoplax adhaerens]EDV28335.1 hypothetical protein TRIADDRAFT_53885 [Trichoplax adhaerens]|eukprot:XP_002110169.1 hypothetical protein TRIADDRAFT_53885 [Trichoplax adhaerens]
MILINCNNTTSTDGDHRSDNYPWYIIAQAIAIAIVSIFIIISNCITLIVISMMKNRKAPDIVLALLAITDLLTPISVFLFVIFDFLWHSEWIRIGICYWVTFTSLLFFRLSMFITTMAALERCLAVAFPVYYRNHFTIGKIIRSLAILSTYCVAIAVLPIITGDVVITCPKYASCQINWSNPSWPITILVIFYLVETLFAVAVTVTSNTVVMRYFHKKSNNKISPSIEMGLRTAAVSTLTAATTTTGLTRSASRYFNLSYNEYKYAKHLRLVSLFFILSFVPVQTEIGIIKGIMPTCSRWKLDLLTISQNSSTINADTILPYNAKAMTDLIMIYLQNIIYLVLIRQLVILNKILILWSRFGSLTISIISVDIIRIYLAGLNMIFNPFMYAFMRRHYRKKYRCVLSRFFTFFDYRPRMLFHTTSVANEWRDYKTEVGKLKTAVDHTSYQNSLLKSALIYPVGQVCSVAFLAQIERPPTAAVATARIHFDHDFFWSRENNHQEPKTSKNFHISDICDFDTNSISNSIQTSNSRVGSPQLRWPLPPINGRSSKIKNLGIKDNDSVTSGIDDFNFNREESAIASDVDIIHTAVAISNKAAGGESPQNFVKPLLSSARKIAACKTRSLSHSRLVPLHLRPRIANEYEFKETRSQSATLSRNSTKTSFDSPDN